MSDQPNLAQSPLAAALPIEDLFLLDPATLSDDQLHHLVADLRTRRNAFLATEAAKAATPKSKQPKKAAEVKSAPEAAKLDKPASDLTLDDLI